MPLIKKAGTTKGIGPAQAGQDEGDTNLLGAAAADGKPAAGPAMQAGVVLQGRYAIEGLGSAGRVLDGTQPEEGVPEWAYLCLRTFP